jgi:hypothetical protein
MDKQITKIKWGLADSNVVFNGFTYNGICEEGCSGWDVIYVTEEQYVMFLDYIALDRHNDIHYVLDELFFSYYVDSPAPNKDGLFRLDSFQTRIIRLINKKRGRK